ncbi:hypothetical protein FWH13_02685 [Candidatus Saccharibacteria bacterium]|nr:hypothetical protein [Candidatus Saccharibacteria bacterium]
MKLKVRADTTKSEVAKAIRGLFPNKDLGWYVKFIQRLQELCTTCKKNADFNQEAEKVCEFRKVRAALIYDGACSRDALIHWYGVLANAKGALLMLADGREGSWPAEEGKNLDRFIAGCKEMQKLAAQGVDWETLPGSASMTDVICMSYICRDSRDPLYKKMQRTGD